jgi:PAS domain S-box-containing protein
MTSSTPPPALPEWLALSPVALADVAPDGMLRACNALFVQALPLAAPGVPLATALAVEAAQLTPLLSGSTGTLALERTAPPTALTLRARPLPGGGLALALEDTQALQAARRDADRAHELLDLARDLGRLGTWERDVASGRGWWDRHVFRMRGFDHPDGEAMNLEQAVAGVVPDDREAFARVLAGSMQQPGTYQHRYRIQTPDGTVRALQSQWVVKPGADGRPERLIGLIVDDTEAHARALEHDAMLSQLGLAVDLAGIAIWRHDLTTNRLHYNEQGWKVLQMTPRPEGLSLEQVRALIHPDDLTHVQEAARTALANPGPTDMEARYRRADGQWRTVMTRRVLQRDAAGQPAAFLGVALDVTDRIDESRRALELARRFELATRAAGIGYWSLEGRAERARWSEQLRAIHGLDAGDPVPTLPEWLSVWVHPDDRRNVERRFQDWVKSGRSSLETDLRIVQRGGEVRHLITHSRVEGREGFRLLFGLVIDVTERRRVEMALREASERAALAARSAGLATWELDLRTGEPYWDPQMWRLRGLEPQAIALSEGERMALVHPDDRAHVARLMEQAMLHDTPSEYEFRVVLPDGRVRWLASRSVPVRDDSGRTVRRIGVNWDVTDSRTAEAVRREREVAQRESQAKSKFLARMSHELRTPLNGVLGFAQLLLAEDDGADEAAAARRRRVEQIRAAGAHLLALINDVLDLAGLEGGEMRVVLQPVPLAPLVAETVPLLEPLLKTHGVTLDCGALDVVPLADAKRLRQVLLNLLTNAVKYNRAGGQVSLEAVQRGQHAIIRVADTGRGMTDEQVRHLFEPFNRLGAEAGSVEGTGIGLAIVKALVERMGGSVHVDSSPGVGSLFELRLTDASLRPVAPPQPTPSRPQPLAGHDPHVRGTLLYVEDNPVNALIVSELVARRPDLRLHVAADGASGVQMAQALRPDLILLDMQLPDFDGHEVLRRVRALGPLAKTPVIALSANAMPEDIERALRAGMVDYWTKPLDFAAFDAAIEQLFGPPPAAAAG